MLHKLVSLLDNNRVQRLIAIQNAVIKFVCHPANPFCDADQNDLRQRIAETCPDAATATWIGRTSSLQDKLKPIAEYLNLNPSIRNAVWNAYIQDFSFYEHVGYSDFVFSYLELDGELQRLIKPLMVYLYEHLGGSGYSKSLMDDGLPFSRGDYIILWEARNTSLHVCPACDGKQPDVRNGKRLSDLDHFLPKSIYPFLAVHPRNLVPICIECNQRIKADTDPLEHEGTVSLSNSFHPYASISAVEVIDVICERDSNGVIHVAIHDREQPQSPRVFSLNHVFALEERWTNRLEEVKKEVIDSLREAKYGFHRIMRYEPVQVDQYVRELLESSEANTKLGRRQNRIIYRSYLLFALANDPELDELVTTFTS